ncbi:MAG TPA: type I polyketide synthase, partial [Acidobacteriaceae bacterium]
PNGPSQEEVIRLALKDAGVDADAISYVEAHGTGTSLGDTIEMQALGDALGRGRGEADRLIVGSVKSNLGHLESAAGVAGLMKVLLALRAEVIPASLHCVEPNPAIDWERHKTRVPVRLEAWKRDYCRPRLAGVSSFGFSGTNAHVIVEEAPKAAAFEATEGAQLIVLSARSERALRAMAERLASRLRRHSEMPLLDVAYTLAAGRTAFAHRAALVVSSLDELLEELDLLAAHDANSRFVRGIAGAAPRIAFLFAGQGGERSDMGLSLRQSRVFREAVAEVDGALDGAGTRTAPAIETIWRNEANELGQSANVQPALFAFQYGLARVWQSWGLTPSVVLGHSMGELVAARGMLTGELSDRGGMVAINAGEAQVQAVLRPFAKDVSIAAINGASSVVISGRAEAVEAATQEFESAGVRVKRLNITYGSHSPAMDRVVPAFYAEAAKVSYSAPTLPIIADMTGTMVADETTLTAGYWSEHLRRPVQFLRCLETLEDQDCDLAIEMGPRAVLTSVGRERMNARTRWVASADGRQDDFDALLHALGEVFVSGASIDWKKFFADRTMEARVVSLPSYPFERQHYWLEAGDTARAGDVSTVVLGYPAPREEDDSSESSGDSWKMERGAGRVKALEEAVRREAARVLGMRRNALPDGAARLADLGMDSLMAVTLRNQLQAMVGNELPATFAFEYETPAEMAMALDLLLWTAGADESGSEQASEASIERDEISI